MNPTLLVTTQRKLIKNVLRDVCQVYPPAQHTINREGVRTSVVASSAKTYEGSSNIPCFVDVARAFIKDWMKFQDVVTDNYVIEVPADFDLDETDEIVWNGDRFKIRKLMRAGELDVTTEALIFHTEKAVE